MSIKIYILSVSQSWDMGFGKEDNVPIIGDGCSWFYRDNDVA